MRIRLGKSERPLEQRVKSLEFINTLLVINVLVLTVGFTIYTFRMRFIIDGIINNIDGIITAMAGISDQIQSIRNSFRSLSEIFSELGEILSKVKQFL